MAPSPDGDPLSHLGFHPIPQCFSMVIDYKGFLNAPADKKNIACPAILKRRKNRRFPRFLFKPLTMWGEVWRGGGTLS